MFSRSTISFLLVIGVMCSQLTISQCSLTQRLKKKALQDNVVHFSAGTVPPSSSSSSRSRSDVVSELARQIMDSQVLKDRAYSFPMTWQQDKGMYPSNIKLNAAGGLQMHLLRDAVSVFDNNMFATAWITICLLEAHLYARVPQPSKSQLSLALEAIGKYHDKNRPFSNSLMNFWPQALNQTTGAWVSTPTNMLKAFEVFSRIPVKLLEDALKALGMKELERILESILSMKSTFEGAFHIPPDFDDTFVNLGLGSLLKEVGQDVPDALEMWRAHNTNISSVLDALRMYAYRPFSQDTNVNTIDVRTFYYLRQFLNEAQAKKEDIALVPTWVQNLDEARKMYYKGVVMPFNMNNVDVTVSANAVYGLTASVLSGLYPDSILEDLVIQQVYVNTSAMIAWQISHQLVHRPELELAYYPSVFEFYWFVARTFSKLETAAAFRDKPLPPAMQEVHKVLKPALEHSMSDDIISKAQQLTDDMLYFDDFLGDGDVDVFNKTVVRGEDRLFTTSMAVNALLSTWTLFDDVSHTLRWKDGTPQEVRSTVEKSVKFLETHILGDSYKPWNTFFSGSVKSSSSTPFGFPSNRIEYLNGTVIPNDKKWPDGPFLFGVQGCIPEAQYNQLIKEKHFGMNTPTTFASYNEPGGYFPFWSSSAYTYATTMLGLARFDNIVH